MAQTAVHKEQMCQKQRLGNQQQMFPNFGQHFAVFYSSLNLNFRSVMNNQNDNKRLVLIGIRRKGEKGFKKRIDSKASSNQSISEELGQELPFAPTSNSDQILNLLSD